MTARETAVTEWPKLARQLRELRRRQGNPSFTEIARRITQLRTARGLPASEAQVGRITVYDCFREQRKRIDFPLVLDIVRALGGDSEEVLRWESLLDAFESRQSASSVVTVTNRLPDLPTAFIGRQEQLEQITRYPEQYWISGMPGAGKSQLAFEAGRRHQQQGTAAEVVIADLRGFSQEGPPADPEAVVNTLLRLLGVAHHERSSQLSAKVTALRNKLLETGTEVILDDALNQQQVQEILPETHGIPLIVTSRVAPGDEIDGVFAHLELGAFSPEESLELLRQALSGERVALEPDAAVALADAAAHLPLAVQLTASRIAARPDWSLADHLELITARQSTLRLNDEVAETFALSYRALPAAAQVLFRLIATYPVTLIDHDSVLALAEGAVDQPSEALATLVRQHLLTAPRPSCYSMHSLLRVHAADLSLEIDRPAVRQAAQQRLLNTLVSRTWAAYQARALRLGHVPRQPRENIGRETMTARQGKEFLQNCTELLLHVAHTTPRDTEPPILAHVSETLGPWLLHSNRIEEAVALHSAALRRAQQEDDPAGGDRARLDLALTRVWTGWFREAEPLLMELEGQLADEPQDEIRRQNTLGIVRERQGDKAGAERCYTKSLELARATENPGAAGFALSNLAGLYDRTGNPERARQTLEESIEIAQQLGDELSAARGMANLASIQLSLDDHIRGEETARQALAHFNKIGHTAGIVACYVNIARALNGRGEYGEALQWSHDGLATARSGGLRQFEVTLLRTAALSQRHLGAVQEAVETAQEAVRHADDVDDPAERGWTRDALADCLERAGDLTAAQALWAEALRFLEEAEAPESAEEIRLKLKDISGRQDA